MDYISTAWVHFKSSEEAAAKGDTRMAQVHENLAKYYIRLSQPQTEVYDIPITHPAR